MPDGRKTDKQQVPSPIYTCKARSVDFPVQLLARPIFFFVKVMDSDVMKDVMNHLLINNHGNEEKIYILFVPEMLDVTTFKYYIKYCGKFI